MCSLVFHSSILLDLRLLQNPICAVVSFCPKKSCRHKLLVSTSFWYWHLNISSVLTSLKHTVTIFWVANEMWVCYWLMVVLSVSFWSLCYWNMSLFVFILDAIFCGTIFFFIFQDSFWLVKKSWYVHSCSTQQFYWVSDHCRGDLRCDELLSEKSCRHKLVVSTSFWYWLLNVSSVFTSLIYIATLFRVVNALWICWQLMGALSFWFWSLCFWNMSFFCVCTWCDLLWYKFFFIFQDSVWLVKKSWCVQCCSMHLFYWICDCCRIRFALWWVFVRKKLSSQIVSFH